MFLKQTIHAVFSAVASAAPERIAVATDAERLSYGELERRSNGIAMQLRERGVGRGDRVGLYTLRSAEAVASMLGILKAGAVYVPFDPAYPAKLLKFVYDDCAPSLMLVQRSLDAAGGGASANGALPGDAFSSALFSGDRVLFIDVDAAPNDMAPNGAGLLPATDREDPAYIMYTSGSTGHPKGVLVPHRAVVRLVIDNPFVHMGPDEVHLQLAPLAFDASTFEIWGALLHGGTLAIVTAPYPSLDQIASAISRHGVTSLWLTAGLFHLMVDQRLGALAPLRQLIAGGDVLSPAHVRKAQQALPSCRLVNGYGPTENTTFTCCYRIPRPVPAGPIPIGQPIAHTFVHVLDDSGRPVPDGQEGELYAGGDGVALGYWNRPELTAQRFVANSIDADARVAAAAPLQAAAPIPGAAPVEAAARGKLYRTGDRVRRRADGNLEFLGRVDRQVKINGKRVELDEIEACLRRSGLIGDAAVTSAIGADGARKIHAYVTTRRGRVLSHGDVRAFLKSELPDYMWPASITLLDALPLSPTGKVDRSRLPPPAVPAALAAVATGGKLPTVAAGASARQTDLEAKLLAVWRKVLRSESVGVNDNFFDLGGTSLQLIQVHAEIADTMIEPVTVIDLFQHPRIRALARWIAERSAATAPAAGTPAALAPAGTAAMAPAGAAAPAGHMLSAAERALRQTEALARARPAGRGNSR
jgi:amino acid adenylation domain-containing protein